MKAVNLLPPDLRGAPKKAAADKPAVETPAGVGAYIVLGALALAVAALAVFVLAGNAVKDREAKLASVKAEAQNATQRATALKPYADFAALVNQRVTTVRSLAEARFDWDRALRDLSRALPENAALYELSGNVSPTVSGATGGNPLRGALPAPALSLKGCVNNQTGVARVMSRLRAVQGVTRVTLATSDKDATPEPQTGTGLTVSGSPYCGTNAPSFDLVVFFERDTARVATAPGMTDPAAAAAAATAPANGTTTSTAGGSSTTPATTQGGGTK